jgi:hypothetical protein
MNWELFLKTLADWHPACSRLFSWAFPFCDPFVFHTILCVVVGITTSRILKILGDALKKEKHNNEFIGPKYITTEDMVVANISALLKNKPQPFSKEDIASMKARGR